MIKSKTEKLYWDCRLGACGHHSLFKHLKIKKNNFYYDHEHLTMYGDIFVTYFIKQQNK